MSDQPRRTFSPLECDLLGEPYGYEEPVTSTTSPVPRQPASMIKRHPFEESWAAKTHPPTWTKEETETQFVIQGRQAGMSASQLSSSRHLTGTTKYDTTNRTKYQLKLLCKAGHDAKPTNEQYQHRAHMAAHRGLVQQEAQSIIQACQSGMTPKEIEQSGIVKHGKNTEANIGDRIRLMKKRGKDVAARPQGQIPRPV
ncbi:MAG: hypothetical protein Q9196_005126 [Gyalolechia fulgens]